MPLTASTLLISVLHNQLLVSSTRTERDLPRTDQRGLILYVDLNRNKLILLDHDAAAAATTKRRSLGVFRNNTGVI